MRALIGIAAVFVVIFLPALIAYLTADETEVRHKKIVKWVFLSIVAVIAGSVLGAFIISAPSLFG